jgi:hypothetical protein
MPRLEQRKDRYLHSPRLVAQPDGGALLSAIAWEGPAGEPGSERLVSWAVAPDGSLGPEQLGEPCARIVALTRGDQVLPSEAADGELHEERGGFRVWVEHTAGVASLLLARAGQPPLLVFRAHGTVLSPCLAVDARGPAREQDVDARGSAREQEVDARGPAREQEVDARGPAREQNLAAEGKGVWIAFHHDVRESDGHADVAKWIALRFVDAAGQVLEPAAEMRERDRERGGIEQSFEFPALVLGDDGALALFGRGSHNFWRQDLNVAGFGARVALSDGEWGSRGRYVAAIKLRDGVLIARRDRRGIEVDLTPPIQGGAPVLRPARVDWSEPSATARVERAADPARRHGLTTLFGDIQQHSAHSDGLGSAHEAYLRARYRYGDDFVALTDHEAFLGKRTGPGEWEYLQRVAELYDAPGQFATLYAYEWTGKAFPGPGHKCVYFPARGAPIVSRDDVPEGRALVQAVRALGGFASPHHIGWTGADEPGHDDEGQPLWEICSCHGCYEHVDHPLGQRGELREQMADVMLRRGHRFGFTASSDSHGLLWHHGEARKRDPYRTGLTAVQARALTREAIMEALCARRCYATSGAKILLDVRADGAPMGSALGDRVAARFEVQVQGTDVIRNIALVGAEGVLAEFTPDAPAASVEARAESPFVYVRVTQADGEMAWSSPVFLGQKS